MVSFQCLFFYTILFILNFFNGFSEQENSRIHRVYHRRNQIIPTIYVDKSGHGNYSTIQSAIDSVPPYNQDWICIYITAGTYRYSFVSIIILFSVTANLLLVFIWFLYYEISFFYWFRYDLFESRVYWKNNLSTFTGEVYIPQFSDSTYKITRVCY